MAAALALLVLLASGAVAALLLRPAAPPRSLDQRFAQAIDGADRLVVTSGLQPPEMLFELNSVEKVGELVSLFRFDEVTGLIDACMCAGNMTFHFYRRGDLALLASYHHGYALGSTEWKSKNAILTESSSEAIAGWFLKNGFPGVRALRDSALAERRREVDQSRRFVEAFPEQARALFRQPMPDDERARLLVEKIGPIQAARSASHALGELPDGWGRIGGRVGFCGEVVRQSGGREFARAVELMTGDEAALLGAARLFFAHGFHREVPKESWSHCAAILGRVALQRGPADYHDLVRRTLEPELAHPEVFEVLAVKTTPGAEDAGR